MILWHNLEGQEKKITPAQCGHELALIAMIVFDIL